MLKIKLLDPAARIPMYGTEGALGADIASVERVDLKPGEFKTIRTGFAMELPKEWGMEIRPRSGMAAKHGVTVLNSPGTIDSDYRGEIKVILINHGPKTFSISPGDRIAQLLPIRSCRAAFEVVPEINETLRGRGGLGSTGDN
jgi:dUTP pyrophosphatase